MIWFYLIFTDIVKIISIPLICPYYISRFSIACQNYFNLNKRYPDSQNIAKTLSIPQEEVEDIISSYLIRPMFLTNWDALGIKCLMILILLSGQFRSEKRYEFIHEILVPHHILPRSNHPKERLFFMQ